MQKYLKYRHWYKLTCSKLKKRFGRDYKFIGALIASTSPRFSIARNIRTALRIYTAFKSNKNFLEDFKKDKAKALKDFLILNSHYNNITKSIEYYLKDNLANLELGGLKVNAFYHNITGDYKYITIDIWMLRYFKHNKAWVNKSEYLKYSRIIEDMAKNEGLNNAEMQAVLWTKTRREHGFKPLSFSKFI